MGRFIVRRIIQMIFVMFAVSVLTFLIFNVIPNSDPATRMAGRHTSQSTINAINKEWGFDDPLPQQYVTMMKKVFTGDLKSQFTQLVIVLPPSCMNPMPPPIPQVRRPVRSWKPPGTADR